MSKFEPGKEKTGGRLPGSLNKKNQEIIDLAKELGCNPAKILMLIALGNAKALDSVEDIDLDKRKEAAKELMPYLYGKRKPVDSDGNDAANPIEDLLNELNESRT